MIAGGNMPFRNFTLTIAALLSVSLVPVSAAASVPTSNTAATTPLLTVGLPFSVASLDPTKYGASQIDQFALETLLQFGPDGQLEPNLATSVAQTSPVTYVYHVRQGVKFWDGDELTAADVAYSLNHERAPGSFSFGFGSVKSITATSPFTVLVTLTHPDASWQYTPTGAEIFEMKFAEANKGTFGHPGVLVMGTGPWETNSLDPTTGAELSANPDWWGGKVPIQHISFKFFSDDTSEALAFRAGEIDLDPFILGQADFASTSGAKLLSTPSCASGYFSMNTEAARWNDVHVRRAVAYALNRQDIIRANGGYASPNYTLIPPQMMRTVASQSQVDALLRSIPLYQYNLAKARQEMAESSYPHGFTAPLEEYTSGDAINVSQVIVAELDAIGIKLQVRQNTLDAWSALVVGPASKRPTVYSYSGCENPDVSWYTYLLGSWNTVQGEYNIADYAPPVVDGLINAGIATTNPAKRFAVYSKLLQNIAINVPYISLFIQDTSIALSSRFSFPGYNQYALDDDYALDIKPAP
jgi:peptide/nickel transport system substrate-binding protein